MSTQCMGEEDRAGKNEIESRKKDTLGERDLVSTAPLSKSKSAC